MKKIIILGASAFPEIHELIKDINARENTFEIIGILDDNQSYWNKEVEGISVLGPLDRAATFPEEIGFVFGIGSSNSRLARFDILNRLNLPVDRFCSLIHPDAKIYSTATVGNGLIMHKGSCIFNNCRVGPFVIIMGNSIIGSTNTVGMGAMITALVSTTYDVKIGAFSFIGTLSSLAPGVEIGPGAMVGMSSFVYTDVQPGEFVLGNPSKVLRRTPVKSEILELWNNYKLKA